MIRLNNSVRFSRILEPIYRLFPMLDDTFADRGLDCWITSANDSRHGDGSFHYKDLAIDIRSKHLPSKTEKRRVLQEIKEFCGPEYDVLLENLDRAQEHYHIEFDPE